MSSDSGSSEGSQIPHKITLELPAIDFPRSTSPTDTPESHGTRNSIYISPNTSDSYSSGAINLNVKFAPLPELAPRKRRSTVPLGVAARARLMRRRRAGYDENGDPLQYSPLWTDDDPLNRPGPMMDDLGLDDPFIALGRLMRVATRKVWRRVAKKGAHTVDVGADAQGEIVVMHIGRESEEVRRAASDEGPMRAEQEFRGTIGETETIRDGRQFLWLKDVSAARSKKHEEN
jgi:hypothetical protein